ncbi:MAG: hypothetical protein ABI602_01000 [Candidatus Saccharibacteria bacterium]
MSMEALPDYPKAALIAHLTADFGPRQDKAAPVHLAARYFSKFVSEVPGEEEVTARLASDDSHQLGSEVAALLEAAPITASFKDFIVNAVRQAHASEGPVSDEVAPAELGLSGDGEGIYSSAQASDIEARFLRVTLHDIIKRNVVTVHAKDQQPTYVIRYRSQYAVERSALNHWLMDYVTTYSQNPFAPTDMAAYLMAAKPGEVDEADAADFAEDTGKFHKFRQIFRPKPDETNK